MSTAEKIVSLIEANQKYEILGEVHEGMNAHAFVARHRHLSRDAFLKVYYADETSTEVFSEPQFLIEATKQGGHQAGNLVEIYDAEMLGDEFVLIAMELIGGGSILRRLQKEGAFPLREAIVTAIGMLHGIACLHMANLVHRDIKPANVMLDVATMPAAPKIGDFGSVARLASSNGTVSASRHSALYVPPEGWAEPSSYGKASDIYQVGMVLYEMINGALPYDEQSHLDRQARMELKKRGISELSTMDPVERCRLIEGAIARRASSRRLLELTPTREYVPKLLKKIISKATAPDASQRYQSASEMIAALQAVNTPNWRQLSDQAVETGSWRGYDWHIEASDAQYVLRRKRTGTGAFRKYATAKSIAAAAELVRTAE